MAERKIIKLQQDYYIAEANVNERNFSTEIKNIMIRVYIHFKGI